MKIHNHSEPHLRALDLMRDGRWDQAARALQDLGPGQDAWVANDLATSLFMDRRIDEAAATLRPAATAEAPALARLNLKYLEKVLEIERNFDPAWTHQDHDGVACPADRPKVSVIVRTHRRTDLLAEALASLKAQTFTDFETIVVNDGGDPQAAEVVAQSGLPRARYVMMPHRGRVHTLNSGLEMAHGEYITGLDDDDVAYPEHLAELVRALDADPDLGGAYPGFRRVGLKDRSAGRGEALFEEERRGAKQDPARLSHTNVVPAIMLMARLSCYQKVGRFCPLLDLGEDWEMWLRLQEHFPLRYLPEVTAEIRERPGDTNITSRRLRQKYLWDNSLLYRHRRLILASAPRDGRLNEKYQRLMALLDCSVKQHPDALDLLNLRGLWEMKKPYHWPADQARWFMQLREPALARAFYGMATRLDPLEPKLWTGWLRARPDRRAEKP